MSQFDRVIIVTKPTALEELLERYGAKGQVQFHLQSRGQEGDFDTYKEAHATYQHAVATVVRAIPHGISQARVTRAQVASFLFRDKDLVIAIGPDGLFVNVAKYTNGQPILTINPDPKRIDGTLMRFPATKTAEALEAILADRVRYEEVALAHVTTNDGQSLYAVNELLIGRTTHASALYTLQDPVGRKERQSSSGILVVTGTGSTGWLKSVVKGAQALTGGKSLIEVPYPRDSRQLIFVVREPYESVWTGASVVFGSIPEGRQLVIMSGMAEDGMICSDGVYEDAINFTSGTVATVRVAERRARLVASF